MDDLQLEFDFLVGKNEVNTALDGIKKNASAASNSIDGISKKAKKSQESFFDLAKKSDNIFSSSIEYAKQSSSSFASLATAYTIGAGSIAAIGYAIKSSVVAAAEAEENISRLNVALKQTGLYTEATSRNFQNLATRIQETTIYSDDQAMSLMATLQTIGQFTDKGLVEATKASIELASAFKMDLQSAAMLVGKAANGNIVALQKMGIEVKKGKNDAETFANALVALSRLSGSSAAEVETLGGSFKYLSNQIGEISETSGFAVSDLLHLKESTIAVANSLKETNKNLKEKPTETTISYLSMLARLATQDVSILSDTYNMLVDDIEKNPIKVKIDTENAISKLPIGTQGIFETGFKGQSPISPMLEDIAKAKKETDKLIQDRKEDEEEIRKKQQEAIDKLKKEYASFSDQVKNVGKTQIEIIEDERKARLKLISDAYNASAISTSDALASRIKIESDFQAKKAEIEKKAEEDRLKRNKDIQDKLAQWIKDKSKEIEDSKSVVQKMFDKISMPENIGAVIAGSLQGKEGARSLISSGAGAVGEALLPGSGQAISQITSMLSQGPEATKAMIKEFSDSIPVLVQGIIESIPVLIEELNKQFPKIIETMADMLGDPNFWVNFSKGMLKASIAAAQAVPKAFIQAIPEFFDGFGKELINAIVNGLNQAVGSVGDAVGGFVESIPVVGDVYSWGKDALGFARGGQVQTVPSGFPNDTFPAMLTSGELVVDRSTVDRLNSFMDNAQQSQSGVTDVILAKILDALSNPQNINTSVTLNGREFANIMLELSRNNARLSV